MNTKTHIVTLLFLFSCLMAFPQTWISIDGSKTVGDPVVEIVNSDTTELILKIITKGFFREEVTYDSVKYDNIYFPNKQCMNIIGFPALPVINKLIALPKNSKFEITVIDSSLVVFDDYLVLPYQAPLLESEKSKGFDINKVFYASNHFFPIKSCAYSDIMIWRSVENFNISISPIRYNPNSKRIYVLDELTIRIRFKQANSKLKTDQYDISTRQNQALKQILLNWEEDIMRSYSPSPETIGKNKENSVQKSVLSTDQYKYLIISPPAYIHSVSLLKFKDWKSRMGLKCKIVSTDTTGTIPDSIKDYISTEYSNCGIEYVLFIGDHSDIPLYTWGSIPSDYCYGCIVPGGNTDYQAEVAVGRFSISNLSELENMINKSINYEKQPPEDNWVEKTLLIAHKENAPGKYQGCKEEIRTYSYAVTSPSFIKAYGAYPSDGGNSSTNQTVIDSINAGIGLINYRGHGSSTCWDGAWSYAYKAFDASEVAKLTNTAKTPVILSIACNNGEVSSSDICLLESFTRGENGSVAFLGSNHSNLYDSQSLF